MAEYNIQYLNLKKRLSTLKVLIEFRDIKDSEVIAEIDRLLKILDDRYSEEKYLDDIEEDINELETKIS